MLHTVNKPPIKSNALRSALRVAAEKDPILLMEDGVLAARPGAATVWLLGGRHLWIGAQAACAVHLYLGAGALPPAATLWGGCVVVLAAVAILQASVTDTDPEGLVRLAWTRLMPLALVDAALTAAQRAGWLPWS